jgi:hypothetical protein
LLCGRFGQEVQNRSIVPNIDGGQLRILRDVGYDPLDECSAAGPEARFRVFEGGSGNVQENGLRVTDVEKRVDQL